jgi:hypothetical protein
MVMETDMRKAGILAAICVPLFVAGWIAYSDLHDWRSVDGEVSRVIAGIDTESTVALRSHVADLDSALRLFQSRLRFLPLNHIRRIEAAEEAIELLREADSLDGTVSKLHDLPPELAGFLRRECFGSKMEIASYAEGLILAYRLTQAGDLSLAITQPELDTTGQLEAAGRDLDIAKRLNKKAEEAWKLMESENQRVVRGAYMAVAKNKLLLALYDQEGGPGWVTPPFPVFDAGKEDETCGGSADR